MEKFSQMPYLIEKFRLPFELNFTPYMTDHRFAGRTVLPAVETCSILASNIEKQFPGKNFYDIYKASFGKFIDIKPDLSALPAFNDIEVYGNGIIISKLITKTKSPSGITRTNEHASLEFRQQKQPVRELTCDAASAPDGICFRVSSHRVYEDLVPFGPAYHNITGTLYLYSSGAVADILAPQIETTGPIGSPFTFDAALHAASVWGQRYYNTVAFPVGFGRRIVLKQTIRGEKYRASVIAKKREGNNLVFDIWIYSNEGDICEAAFDVVIKDVTDGKMKPPGWIIDNDKETDPLGNISGKCRALSVIELDAISDFAVKALSDDEMPRLGPMVEKRRKSYLGARLSCKFVSRKLAGGDLLTPAHKITTVSDEIYPACPMPDGRKPFKCSVSHDGRFAIAAASPGRIGIDVEEISDRVLKANRMFMSGEEIQLVDAAESGKKEASLKIWSIKEAVTKALNIGLGDSWKQCRVTKIGENASIFLIDGSEVSAYHAIVDNHLFTIVVFEA